MNVRGVPAELRRLNQWVAYLMGSDGSKIPVNPATKKQAKTNRPDTWGSFAQAVALWQAYQGSGIQGIGFVLTADDSYSIIDLDNCRNPESGEITQWARGIITRLNSFTELSRSGRGVHVIVKGALPGAGQSAKWGSGTIRLRSERFFFAVTGQHLAGTPGAIEDREKALAALYFKTLAPPKPPPQPPPKPAPDPTSVTLSPEELTMLAGTLRRQGRDEAGIKKYLGGLNRESAAPQPESIIDQIAHSIARKPQGLRKGDGWAAYVALAELGGGVKRVGHTALKERIRKNQDCGDTTAKEAIRAAVKARLIKGPQNGFKGFTIRRKFRLKRPS